MHTEVEKCRGCGNKSFVNVIDLGNQYIVDFVKEIGGQQAPLTLIRCTACHLVQLEHSVSPDRLYKTFWYRSGINEQMRNELLSIVQKAQAAVGTPKEKTLEYVLDIGCNDGTLLGWYDAGRYVTIGVDPCAELVHDACNARPKRIDYGIGTYFSKDVVEAAVGKRKFKIITAISMFYDLENPLKFLEDCRDLLLSDGVIIIQMNYLLTMYANVAFDNICHEHLTYFSISSLAALIDRAGLELNGIEQNGTNGGSIRAYITHKGSKNFFAKDRETRIEMYSRMMAGMHLEAKVGLNSDAVTAMFRNSVESHMAALHAYLSSFDKLYVYGASTRGTTVLQYLDSLGKISDRFVGVAERDPNKYGLKMVGTWTPIVPEEEARAATDTFLVLPWHFRKSIVEREKDFLAKGGKLIFPLPEPSVLTSTSVISLLAQKVSA